MMSIGEFAAMTGLSAKALRFYDEKDVLRPREVDEVTGYRRYGAGQVRQAATIRLLRDMGMPIAQVREVLTCPDRSERLVADFVDSVHRERARQDAAISTAERTLSAYDEPVEVTVRTRPPQHWIGVVAPLDPMTVDPEDADEAEAATQACNEQFGALYLALQERGLTPDGPFWTAMGPGADRPVRMLLCWPTPAPAGGVNVQGAQIVTGLLPKREELSVRIPMDDPATDSADSTPVLPQIVAFFEAVEGRDLDEREVRQVGVLGPDGVPVAMDLTITSS